MINTDNMSQWKQEIEKELKENILGFWIRYAVDQDHGGLIGRMKNDLTIEKDAPKGLILYVRTLWTFSAAYRFDPRPEYLEMTSRVYNYLKNHFFDNHGGCYWMLDAMGHPLDTKKRVYGQAFTIYALTEYALATGEDRALQEAKQLFEILEDKCVDKQYDGYYETFDRDWTLAKDLRLSEKDMDLPKSMNNHLHVLEAYTNLYRVWKEPRLARRLQAILRLFLDRIIKRDEARFQLFFNESWDSQCHDVSFGHDIEGSWLLNEAAELLDQDGLLKEVEDVAIRMADAVLENGIDHDGGLFYEGNASGEIIDSDKHWWPQAEALVAFLNAFQLTRGEVYLNAARKTWKFIISYIKDHLHGEWYWKVTRDRQPVHNEYKICEWKSPYHNGRACMEAIRRIENLL
jgi:mannobiose 2-epimerase